MMTPMQSSTLRFAEAVRALGLEARRLGLVAPSFRSPPRLLEAERTIRRFPSGHVTVAVVVRGRPWAAVLADLIEGVVTANDLHGAAATRARTRLWSVVDAGEVAAA
jgi:hypothetical protein